MPSEKSAERDASSGDGLRVTLVVGSMPPMRCGVGDYTAQLATALTQYQRICVSVVSSYGASASPNYDVIAAAREWSLRELRPLLRAIRATRPDLVHFQFPSAGYGAGILRLVLPTAVRIFGIPVVQTWHEFQRTLFLSEIPNAVLPGALITVRPGYLEQSHPMIRTFMRWKKFRYIANASAIPATALADNEREAIKAPIAAPPKRLIGFFGFVHAHKGIETLFDVTEPERDHILVVGDLTASDPYHATIQKLLHGRGSATGFVPALQASRLLAACDAVVLPFREGGGEWNSSLHAVNAQGTFAVVTSRERRGYDESSHTYFVAPGDNEAIRRALDQYAGVRAPVRGDRGWQEIAAAHLELYRWISDA